MHACYQCLPLFQNLRFNKLINNLSCVHRRAEVLGNVTRPAINSGAGYSDGRQMAPVPSLSWLNNFPEGAFHTRGCFCSESPWVVLSSLCFQPFERATVRWRSAPLSSYILHQAFSKCQTPLQTTCPASISPLHHPRSRSFRQASFYFQPRPSGCVCSRWCAPSFFFLFFHSSRRVHAGRRSAVEHKRFYSVPRLTNVEIYTCSDFKWSLNVRRRWSCLHRNEQQLSTSAFRYRSGMAQILQILLN